jgi:DNA-binding NtrC family response regulator
MSIGSGTLTAPFPRARAAQKAPKPENHQNAVLIVDENAELLITLTAILADADYKVLPAGSGQAALRQSKACKTDIHLLLADFQMREMNGVDLAAKLTADRPTSKVLLMSGFTYGMLVLNEEWHFLPKPFIPSQLRTLVSRRVYPDRTTPPGFRSSQASATRCDCAPSAVAACSGNGFNCSHRAVRSSGLAFFCRL